MNKNQLRIELKFGLGNSYLFLKEVKNIAKYKEIVEKIMLNHIDYDMQSEGTRGYYFYEILSLFDDDNYFIDLIINKIYSKQKNGRLLNHLFDILFQFAYYKNEKANSELEKYYQKLYEWIKTKKYFRKHVYYNELDLFANLCIYLIQLNDISRTIKIIEDLGKLNPKAYKGLEIEYLFFKMGELFSNRKINQILRKNKIEYQIKSEKYIRPILDKNISANEIIENAKEGKLKYFKCRLFAKEASKNELIKLAKYIEFEENIAIKMDILRVFHHIEFPLNPNILISLLNTDNLIYKDSIGEALVKIKSKFITDFAYNQLKINKNVETSLLILANNINKKNLAFFTEEFYKINYLLDPYNYHFFLRDLSDIIARKRLISIDVLEYIYHNLECSYCRELVVRNIIKRKGLSKALTKELLHDCNLDIRLIANSYS